MLKTIVAASLAALMIPAAAHAQDLTTMTWDEIVAQAKEEGELSWFQWYFQDRFREEVKAFETEYGIKVTIADGAYDANFQKFLAEKDRPEGDIDVLSLPGGSFQQFAPEDYLLGPLNTVLPDGDTLRYSIEGGDTKGYAPAFWGNQSGIAYNPARISVDQLPRTLDDFATFMTENPGEIGFNVEQGGSGPAFIELVTRTLVPDVDYAAGTATPEVLADLQPSWDWFNSHKSDFVITASNADSVTRLNAGEFMIVPAWEDFVAGLQNKGEVSKDIKVYIPEFGMPGGGNVAAIPANAKHKAAALVFIHWLTSAQTQGTFNKNFGAAPQNPEADSSAALISDEERGFSINWSGQPLRDEIKKQFIEQVTLN